METMSEAAGIPGTLNLWIRRSFPEFPYLYPGKSGATLLFDALRAEPRDTVVLPAFTCPTLSFVAARAEKRILHVEVEPNTLHMRWDLLTDCLSGLEPERTIVLVDHAFGYPFPHLARLREEQPRTRLIEDCVRALGASVEGQPVGREGDWSLLSLHKTSVGINHGALLLTRTPCSVRGGDPPPVTPQQWMSGVPPLRAVYEELRRRRGPVPDSPLAEARWAPEVGVPNRLAVSRYLAELRAGEAAERRRRTAWDHLREALSGLKGVRPIRTAPGCRASAHFFSFRVAEDGTRDQVWERLYRRGCFVDRDWYEVPSSFPDLRGTFPYGSAGSEALARSLLHVPVASFLSPRRRAGLVECLRRELRE
jgi:dTDP-4-amino-4,6-dideoxygalactose transaminase